MRLDDAKREISEFFRSYGVQARHAMRNSSKGKIYELFCLSRTLDRLKSEYNLQVVFKGTTVDFRSSPGKIDRSRSYFVLHAPRMRFELHTDIEFLTLGSRQSASYDRSRYHEVDIAVVDCRAHGRPEFDALAVAVECKAHANFTKGIVKQVLGVRREMSLFVPGRPTILAMASNSLREVEACPPSEYWLAYTDPAGCNYRQSPATFGIEFLYWCP